MTTNVKTFTPCAPGWQVHTRSPVVEDGRAVRMESNYYPIIGWQGEDSERQPVIVDNSHYPVAMPYAEWRLHVALDAEQFVGIEAV